MVTLTEGTDGERSCPEGLDEGVPGVPRVRRGQWRDVESHEDVYFDVDERLENPPTPATHSV